MEENDNINIMSLLKAVKQRWLMVVLIIILSLTAAFLIALNILPSYTAVGYIRIALVAERITENPIMLKCYVDAPENIKKIADKVGLNYDEVEGNIKLELIQNPDREKTIMQVLKISAKATNPQKAALMVDTAMSIVEDYTSKRYETWNVSMREELDRIKKATDQMFILMNGFLPQQTSDITSKTWFFSAPPKDQYSAEAQGLAVGNGMLAQSEILRLESEMVSYLDQRTEATTRRVNPIPPLEPDPGIRLIILLSTAVVSIVVTLGLATYLYAKDQQNNKC